MRLNRATLPIAALALASLPAATQENPPPSPVPVPSIIEEVQRLTGRVFNKGRDGKAFFLINEEDGSVLVSDRALCGKKKVTGFVLSPPRESADVELGGGGYRVRGNLEPTITITLIEDCDGPRAPVKPVRTEIVQYRNPVFNVLRGIRDNLFLVKKSI